ncbi:ABC transporter substrate-binding protein [Haematobacter massiliensis]|uniref:ABC transporter substrate-binding protein n=1 Tax=Haematobacter massiliensis TaxID=195105 RepID=A0A086Y6Y2_9RHOB|nr:ABC transporter substrate-binding protein [Haematobacter massiliensis]KFI30032.1 ABC transporter substrate-binding protein [Haematobacter massiliensis]OWJ69795.1 ABC transporter substrate-binding protein [Haematobacter massiliensis]OWJ86967.1 ABC transporter substrate-binding protein [Haematobacter massiliensis]QBJ25536.1 ABC transporter substrate-binding protein [Haematobacter massiliensis]
MTTTRRSLLRTAAGVGLAAPFLGLGVGSLARAQATAGLKPIKFASNASAICLAPVFVARDHGIFEKHGLDVEIVNFGASTEALLEAIATGKADGGIGMALRWLKALEQGFDVKITAGTHGGCSRLVTLQSTGITELSQLKGKTIGVTDLAAPGKNFFSILLHQSGIDPETDVKWRAFSSDVLEIAAERGEIDAIADGDPRAYFWLKDTPGKYVQVASNLDHGFENRVCCIAGLSGSLVRDDPATAKALTRALLEAQDWTVARPEDAAKAFLPQAPRGRTVEDLVAVLKDQTHDHSPTGGNLKTEIAQYATELKQINIFRRSTDPEQFAERVYADVLTA